MTMYADSIDEALIGAIYGPAVHEGDWRPALERFRVLLNAHETALPVFDGRCSVHLLHATGRMLTPELVQQYQVHYGHLDPKLPILAANGPGFLFNDANHFDADFVEWDPFYQEYSKPMGNRHTLDMCLRDSGRHTVYLAVMRGAVRGPYNGREESVFRQASRHFLRAIDVKERLDLAESAGAAIDRLATPIFVIDRSGRVLLANRTAESLAGSGEELRLCRGRLYARSPDLNRRVNDAISSALAGGPSMLHIPRVDGPASVFWCIPLPETSRLLSTGSPGALVMISDPARVDLNSSDLAALYGLTDAECQLALALAAGHTLKAVAARRAVKLSTVRTQLLSVLDKMGLHRQADLTRVLAQLSCPVQDIS